MHYIEWIPDQSITPPVYLDANILVGTIIREHNLYTSCANITATLLARNSEILLSPICIDECLWIVAKLAYCKLHHHRPNTLWNKSVYDRWRRDIFQSYGSWIDAVGGTIRDWSDAGAKIEFVPKTEDALWDILKLVPLYMRDTKLTPADAFHLAFASTYAKTFITADSDFKEVQQNPPYGDLTILKVTDKTSKNKI